MKKTVWFLMAVLVTLSMVLSACTPPTTPVPTKAPDTSAPTKVPSIETPVVPPTTEQAPQPPVEPQPTPTPDGKVLPREETLYVSGSAWGPASTWNPFQPGNLANTTGTHGFVYEFLFAFDPQTGAMTPWLAESGAWKDATTFDVTLRQGLTWSDGQPLTAADVKFTFELAQKFPALPFSGVWSYLTGVTAVDDTNLKFTFKDPLYQEWAFYLYNIPIVPEHLWKDKSEADITAGANEKPVGSGAYLYMSHAEDRNNWVRNDNWWGISVFGKPAPKYIVDARLSSNNVALGMVLKGELDLSNNFLPGVAELVNKGYVSTYFPKAPYMLSANTAVLFLNTTKKPMDDAKFRKALAFSIDVSAIVKTAYADLVLGASPTGLLPTLSKYDDQDVISKLGWTFDTAKAKELLAAAGYKDTDSDGFVEAPDGSKIELEVTCPSGWTDWMAAIDIIASSAQAAGINVKAATPDYGGWNSAMQGATFDMTLNNWANLSNTPWTVYNFLFKHPLQEQMQSGNFGKYGEQKMFDLVDALAKVASDDEAGMKAAVSKIQELMLTDVPMIPLWYNGLWAQWSSGTWTNWPSDAADTPKTLPSTWTGYWQMGGLQTVLGLKPVTK